MDTGRWLFLCILIVWCNFSERAEGSGSDMKILIQHLLKEYDSRVRPVINQNDTTVVDLKFNFNSLIEFDERLRKFEINGWFEAQWIDEFLTWNSSEYGGINKVLLPEKDVWVPDLVLANAHGKVETLKGTTLKVTIFEDGHVLWFPGDVWAVPCSVHAQNYPFDLQSCTFNFTFWNSEINETMFNDTTRTIDLYKTQLDGQWKIYQATSTVEMTSYNRSLSEKQQCVIHFVLFRQPFFTIITVIFPIVLLSFLNTCVFLVPVESGERSSFAITIYLSYGVFLGRVTDNLPDSSQALSYLMLYILMLLLISGLITLTATLQCRLFIYKGDNHVPFFIACIVIMCCSRKNKPKPSQPDTESVVDNTPEVEMRRPILFKFRDLVCACCKHGIMWKDAMATLDRLLFVFFALFVSLCTSSLFYIMRQSQNDSLFDFELMDTRR